MHRRMFLGSALTVLVVVGLASPAVSAGEAVQEYVETEVRAEHSPDGRPQTLVIEKVVSPTGEVLRSTTTVSDNARFRTMAKSPFACAHEGHREGFRQHDRKEAIRKGRNDFAHFLFFPYSVDNARRSDAGGPQQQWLICGVGGADSNNGSRTVMSGPGVYFRDQHRTYKLGHVWREGKTPASYSLNLGFEVPTKVVNIKGGISQNPTSALRGSPRPPFNSDLDAYARNGANGWWEADCAPDCVWTGGSNGYQGSVVEGLWEFPQGRSITVANFAMAGFHKHFCSNPFGCR